MAQQQSPWLEGAYGWSFGEGGWNTGMDSNLLKFSFMFDRNVDSIVSSLPAAVNGQSHYLTTDNRLYFAVGTTYFSTVVPKWFEFKVRITGATYQFNGASATQINSPDELDSRLDVVELTVATLGSAAFESVEFFATQTELDVVEATSAAYTDALRGDLIEATDLAKGASILARAVVVVAGVQNLSAVPTDKGQLAKTLGYFSNTLLGEGDYLWDASRPKGEHDGGKVISPTVPWDGLSATLPAFLVATGETDPSGNGCWVLQAERVLISQYGARASTGIDDQASIVAAMQSGEPLDFADLTYEFGSIIDLTLTKRIDWAASLASLKYTGGNVQSCLKLTVPAFAHQIAGQITVNAQEASHTGWFFDSLATGAINVSPDLTAVQLSAINVRRHTLGLAFGDAIIIQGGFHRVYLSRPYVFNARITAGAEIPSVSGMFGISVVRAGSGETKYLDIVNPHVENVYSDDPAYFNDQDGIRIFASITAATEATHNVWGGTVKNVRNRSVKHQGQSGIVAGLRIIKEASVVDPGGAGVAPNDWDVEAQHSGITVRDIHFTYTGYGSRGVARYIGNPVVGRTVANGTISGIRGEIIGTSIFGIVSISDTDPVQGASVSDVNVVGPSSYIVQHISLGAGVSNLNMTNITAEPSIAGVQEVGAPLGYVLAVNVVNSGATSGIPLMSAATGGNDRRLQAVNVYGWTDAPSVFSKTGVVADAGLLQIAPSGVGISGGIVLISAGDDRAATCLAAFDNTGVTVLQQTAARFVGGTTTEPGSGDFRLYFSGGKLNIRNRSGASRSITANLVG